MPAEKKIILISIAGIMLIVAGTLMMFYGTCLNYKNTVSESYYIPVDIMIDGTLYTMEDIEKLCKYHGTDSIIIRIDKKNPIENEVYFYRSGQKCNLFTDAAVYYLRGEK